MFHMSNVFYKHHKMTKFSLHTPTVYEMDTNASGSPYANLIWVIDCSRSLENSFHIRCNSTDTWNTHFIAYFHWDWEYLHYRFLLLEHLTKHKNLFLLSTEHRSRQIRLFLLLFCFVFSPHRFLKHYSFYIGKPWNNGPDPWCK